MTSGVWTDASGYKQSTAATATLKVMFLGDENVTLTMGEGSDHGRYDVYIGNSLWRSFDGYAASSGDKAISIPLESDGPHLLEIRVRSDRNASSTGNVVRFKQLVVDGEYDLRQIDYSYDKLSRLIAADHIDGTTHSYGYDPAGNMVNMDGVTRTYNAANQMTHDGTSALSYDNNGNLQTGGYVWDRANRLLSQGGLSYAYDGLNNRISQDNGSLVTQYLLDTQPGLTKVIAQTTGTSTDRFIHGPRGIHAMESHAGDWSYMAQDGLGSVRAEIDANSAVSAIQSYALYGQPMNAMGSFGSPFGFTGEQIDNSDLLYLRARYYNPSIGIFPSLDPFEGISNRPMSLNGYLYVENDPVNATDPSGNSPCYNSADECPIPEIANCQHLNVLDSRYPFCIYANTGSPCPPSWQFDQQYEIHTPLDANVSICRQGERSLRAGDAWLEYTVGVEVENPNYALRVAETAFYLSCIPNAGVRSVVRSALRYGARNLLQPAGQTIWRACVGQDIMSARNLSVASGLAGAVGYIAAHVFHNIGSGSDDLLDGVTVDGIVMSSIAGAALGRMNYMIGSARNTRITTEQARILRERVMHAISYAVYGGTTNLAVNTLDQIIINDVNSSDTVLHASIWWVAGTLNVTSICVNWLGISLAVGSNTLITLSSN